MRVKAFLFALCCILLLGACGTPKTGGTVYNIMDYGAKGDGVTGVPSRVVERSLFRRGVFSCAVLSILPRL